MMPTIPGSAAVPNDADLVQASLAGNRGAFGDIVARYQALICSLAYSATGNLSRSEELAQETFFAAWRQLAELREPAKLRAWLCGIARNLISNAQRRAGREPVHLAVPFDPAHEAFALEPSPSAQAIRREEETILWRALEQIPATYREPLILFYREHRSVEAVARELEVSPDAVKQRLARGRAMLHEEVIGFVEGTLERTKPGPAFTAVVLGILPTPAVITPVAAGALAAPSSTGAKAASAGGLGFAATCLALLGALGGYVGWEMGGTCAQSSAERASVLRFWRMVAGGVLLCLFPAFGLMMGRRAYPWLQPLAIGWLGALYVALLLGFVLYAWRQHRRIRAPAAATESPPPLARRKLLTWAGLGTFAMLLVLAFSLWDSGGWRTTRLRSAEAPAFIATHPNAQFSILEYRSGARSLSMTVSTDGRRRRFTARLNAETLDALQQIHAPVKTLVQGRDFEIFGWPGRYLFLLAFLLVAAGAVLLIRVGAAPRGESCDRRGGRTTVQSGSARLAGTGG